MFFVFQLALCFLQSLFSIIQSCKIKKMMCEPLSSLHVYLYSYCQGTYFQSQKWPQTKIDPIHPYLLLWHSYSCPQIGVICFSPSFISRNRYLICWISQTANQKRKIFGFFLMLGCCWHFFDSGSLAGGCCCFACNFCLLFLTLTVSSQY